MLDQRALRIDSGFCSLAGRRVENQDYVALFGDAQAGHGAPCIAALADGVSHGNAGRIAAELTVRLFIDGMTSAMPTPGVGRNAARVVAAINAWVHAAGRSDAGLANAASTFTALVLQGRTAHVLHVGDSRAYLLHDAQLTRLTEDHTLRQPEREHVLIRAIGLEAGIRLDHGTQSLRAHDRLLLCTDGVHGVLADAKLREALLARRSPGEDAQRIVEAAIAAGSQDNVTCIVIDVLSVPEAAAPELHTRFAALPLLPPPRPGDLIDGFVLGEMLSDGRYSRLLRATDTQGGTQVVLKFPQQNVTPDSTYHLAFVREAWVAARLHSPFVGETIELPEGRQSRLYSVMPYYEGETLEQRLTRVPRIGVDEGCDIALKLTRAIAVLHRAGVIHRDIKPDNVMLERGGGLRLLDLGVARLANLEDFPTRDIPGTPSYMAPELFDGQPGNEATDQYALGVTLYRLFSGRYPYGEVEPFSRPRFTRLTPLSRHRPELPAWIDHLLTRAVAVAPAERFGDVLELAHELENGRARGQPRTLVPRPLYERNPLLFWKVLAALLAIALVASLGLHAGR